MHHHLIASPHHYFKSMVSHFNGNHQEHTTMPTASLAHLSWACHVIHDPIQMRHVTNPSCSSCPSPYRGMWAFTLLATLLSAYQHWSTHSVWKSSYKTGNRPGPDRTLTDQDRKFSGPIKTVTAVWSLVHHHFQIFKTDENRLQPVSTGLSSLIAVCNNVGEPAFLGPNHNFENWLLQAS